MSRELCENLASINILEYIGIENRWKVDIKRLYSLYDVFQKSKEGSGKYVNREKQWDVDQ